MQRIVDMNLAAGTAVSNTVTQSSLAKYHFKQNELSEGKIFEFECLTRVTAQNSTDTVAVGVTFGTNATTPGSNTACGIDTAVDAAVNDIAIARGRIHVQSATRAVMTLELSDSDTEGTISMEPYVQILTIAADTDYYLDVTATWSVASSSNSVQAEAWATTELC
jgi:hypothetical protein